MDGETLFFLFYLGLLLLSGVLLLIAAAVGAHLTGGARATNVVIGLAALGYAIYLILTVFVNGGRFSVFYLAFIAPVFAVVQIVKGIKARAGNAAEQNAIVAQMAQGYQAPQGYQPQQGYQMPQGQQMPQGYQPQQGQQMPQGYQPQQGYQVPQGQQMPQGYQPQQMPPAPQQPQAPQS